MTFVTVLRHIPRPITGMIGVLYDRAFEGFEANLDWLETTGVLVERFDPTTAPGEVARRPVVQQLLSANGDSCLPLILVNDAVISQGGYLSRTQLARAVGGVRSGVPQAVARQLAAIGAAAAVGTDDDIQREAIRARQLGIGEDTVRLARESGARLRHMDVPAA